MTKVRAVVVNRPKIDTDGRTDVVLDKDGAVTPIGYVLQTRNSGEYRAYDLEDSHLGTKSTRSQAMHLVQRTYEGRDAKRTLPHEATADVSE